MEYLEKWDKFFEAKSAEDLVDLFKISTEIDGQTYNGYSISGLKDERTIINYLVSSAKNRFIKNQFIFKEDGYGEGYMYSYIIYLIMETIKKDPSLTNESRRLISKVSNYFNSTKLNKDKISRLEAEKMRRDIIKRDPDSFKTKGASIRGSSFYRELKKEMDGKIPATDVTSGIVELFEEDIIQWHPKEEDFQDDNIVYHKRYKKRIIDELIKLDNRSKKTDKSFENEFISIDSDKKREKMDKKEWLSGIRTIPKNSRIWNLFLSSGKKGGFI